MKRGMTLLELMIVIAIIGVLLGIAIPNLGRSLDRSREKTTMENLSSLRLALESYNGDWEVYPNNGDPDNDGDFNEHMTEGSFTTK